MRLTLRTLLSYLDNVLEEPARTELRQQIEASEHAGEWVHRTRDVMRRLKLAPPAVEGAGSADDPNTVAEYLNRTLPEANVGEFERACLESDAMLAEVASCHHVLAMFLQGPAEIDPDTRNRLLRLQTDLDDSLRARPASFPKPMPAAPAEAAALSPAGGVAPTGPAIPDYLRSPARREWVRWMPAIAAGLLLALTSVVAFGPWGRPEGEVATNPGKTVPTGGPEVFVTPKPPSPPDDPQSTDITTGESETTDDPPAAPFDDNPLEPQQETLTEGADAGNADAEEAAEADPPAPDAPPEHAGEPEPEPTPVVPEVIVPDDEPIVATFTGAGASFVVIDAGADGWRRLSDGATVESRARLIAMPQYRVPLSIRDLRVTLAGPAEVVLDPETPAIELRHGRLLLENASTDTEPTVVKLRIDGSQFEAALGPGAKLAVEADRPYAAGWPVLEAPAPMLAVANNLVGSIDWSTIGEQKRVSKPLRWTIVESRDSPMPIGFGEPGWAIGAPAEDYRARAAEAVAAAVVPDKAVWPQLQEVAQEDRFRENRSLAAECNVAIDAPDMLIESLRDPEQADGWVANVAALRRAMSRSTESAAAVGRVLEEKFGAQKAAELVELLVGFTPADLGTTPEEIRDGVAVQVILPALTSEDLATRVLGALALEELVAPLERPFRPLDSERRRIPVVRTLERLIAKGELAPRAR